MKSIVADLHIHTTNSDGQINPNEVLDIATENNLDVISITDHSRYYCKKPIKTVGEITIINGMELKVKPKEIDELIDLLAYGITPSEEIDELVERMGINRIKRANKILDLIEEHTGHRIDFVPTENTTRGTIARAIADDYELPHSYGDAFDELIGKGCKCHIPRIVPSFEEGVSILENNSELISLAHPYRYDNVDDILDLAPQIDGVECNYLYGDAIEVGNKHDRVVNEFDLTRTGGSDAHIEDAIGSCGLNKSEYNDFKNSLEKLS